MPNPPTQDVLDKIYRAIPLDAEDDVNRRKNHHETVS